MLKHLLLLVVVISTLHINAQDTLVAAINDQLIKVNQNDAGMSGFVTTAPLGPGESPFRLTWSSKDQSFYTISEPTSSGQNAITRVAVNGTWSVLGPVTVPGQTVYFIEGIAYNPADQELYVSASLNGLPPQDYWCETLLKVNIETLEGTIIGTFSHTAIYEPEADLIAFGPNGDLYYNDTEINYFRKFLKQDIGFLYPPDLLFDESTDYGTNSLLCKDDKLYYTRNRELNVIDLNTLNQSTVGSMFTASDFNGSYTVGLTYVELDSTASTRVDNKIEINIYPNPADKRIIITTDNGGIQKVELFNATGQIVQKIVATNNIIMDVSAQIAGIYYIVVHTNVGVERKKLVIQ